MPEHPRGDRVVTTVKQLCLGVAVAGVVAGAGSALATGIAYAEPTDSPSTSDSSTSSSSDTSEAPSRKTTRHETEKSGYSADRPRTTAPAHDAESEDAESEDDSPARNTGRAATSEPDDEADSGAAEEPTVSEPTNARTFGIRRAERTEEDSDDTAEATQPAAAQVSTPDTPEPAVAETVVAPQRQVVSSYLPTRPRVPLVPVPLIPAPAAATTVSTAAAATTRNRVVTTADVAAQVVDPTKQRVLVIGVDGTNLSRILDDPANTNFFELMDTGTTSASTVVGHTTISNPSWTAILTGVWDTKSGVINNVFTPSTYYSWPTVFNQLEEYNPDIETKAIADWEVIADIANGGTTPADVVIYIPQGENDPVYAEADAAVTDETVKSILGTELGYQDVPNFLFTYMTGVDQAGHLYGGASPEYAAAIQRADTNVGLILDAVAQREAATCAAGPSTCEDWTIIMVTDHGHQPQQGFGHGFQSPDETSTFVIVDGPGYGDGQMNLQYSIVDITPTVVSMFGLDPRGDADGVPLSDLGSSTVDPADLHQALQDAIDMYGWPDIQTNVALSLRTIFATIPYYVDTFTTDITDQLRAVADQGIFLVSDIAALAVFPVQFIGDAVYAVTNAIAQVVARLTGAGVIPPSPSTTVQRDGQPYPWILT
jgi:hypothetical protein